ncbi:MAG: VCBS domain-containing protein, partial [Planctomycetes bacterium]|nr:VCBS domain-containing protein [Planctomycetota bacterium]
INSSTGQVTVANGSLLNFEAAASHNIVVRATDQGGLTFDRTVTINLTNVNEAPDIIVSSSADLTMNFNTPSTLLQNTTGTSIATSVGSVSYAYDLAQGSVIEFGTDGQVNIDVEDRPTLNSEWTLSSRFKDILPAPHGWNTLFRGVTDHQLLIQPGTGLLGYYDNDTGGLFKSSGYNASSLDDGQWHTATVTRQSSGLITYFIDGVQVGTVTDTTVSNYLNWYGSINQTQVFARYLDDFRYFGRAITSAEAAAIHNNTYFSIQEGSANGSLVGTLQAVDQDTGNSHTFQLLNNAGGRFAIHSTSGAISVANSGLLDFETATSHTIVARVTDQGNLSFDRTLTINVTNVNEAPTLNTVTTGLAGWWKLDESSGTSTADASGNGNNGTLINGAAWQTGQMGNAIEFDGTDDYINISASNVGTFGTGDFAITFWINADRFTSAVGDYITPLNQGLVGPYAGYAPNWYVLLGQHTGTDGLRFGRHGVNQYDFSAGSFNPGQWYHMAIVRSSSTIAMYVDGVSRSVSSIGGGVGSYDFSAGSPIQIGAGFGSGAFVDGKMDDVRIYKRALSAGEVNAIASGLTMTTLTSINEDSTNSAGNTISQLIADGTIADSDYTPSTSAPEAIAITAINNTNGTWQFKLGSGSWSNINSTLLGTQALLLDSSDSVRFVPNADWSGNSTFTYRAWDKTSGTIAGSYVTISSTGSSTPYSSEIGTAQITVTAVNDAPVALADTATAIEAGGVSNGTAGTNPTGNVLTNDTDADSGDTKTVTGVAAGTVGSASTNVGSNVTGAYGSINIAANGSYTYTVDNSNAAVQALRTTANTLSDVFTYTMRDTAGLTSTTQITVTIQGANDAPICVDDTATALEAGWLDNTATGKVSDPFALVGLPSPMTLGYNNEWTYLRTSSLPSASMSSVSPYWIQMDKTSSPITR